MILPVDSHTATHMLTTCHYATIFFYTNNTSRSHRQFPMSGGWKSLPCPQRGMQSHGTTRRMAAERDLLMTQELRVRTTVNDCIYCLAVDGAYSYISTSCYANCTGMFMYRPVGMSPEEFASHEEWEGSNWDKSGKKVTAETHCTIVFTINCILQFCDYNHVFMYTCKQKKHTKDNIVFN